MAKEKFLIVAQRLPVDCFPRFSETENCAAIDAGNADHANPYSWIESSFELVLIRHREATHICSLTPSAWQVWLQNYFIGIPNGAWESSPDPDGLEFASGDETGRYGTYRDQYDSRFIAESFMIDTIAELDLRAPGRNASGETRDSYHSAIWNHAEQVAFDMRGNGLFAPILETFTYRQWERERKLARRAIVDIERGVQP